MLCHNSATPCGVKVGDLSWSPCICWRSGVLRPAEVRTIAASLTPLGSPPAYAQQGNFSHDFYTEWQEVTFFVEK